MFWTRKEEPDPGHISIERRSEIIDEFAELNPEGTVVTCGGEGMLDLDRYFAITGQSRKSGLGCFSVTNGTIITDEAMAEQMIAEGPTEITISLNSHLPEVHDHTRGVAGSFDAATGAIRRLLTARQRLGKSTPVYAMAVICEQNYRELDAFYQFVLKDLGADKLKLNFLQPTFGPLQTASSDAFYRKNIISDYEELGRIIDSCDAKYGLNINPEWLRVVKLYHRSMHANDDASRGWLAKGTEEPICNSYERNIMVDMFGEARLCFSDAFPGRMLRKRGDMAKLWYRSGRTCRKMAKCTACCGISHSVRRESCTIKTSEDAETDIRAA